MTIYTENNCFSNRKMAQLYIYFKNLSKTEIVLCTKVMALYSFNIYNTKLTKEY